ncbi:hypothetical protein Tco_0851362 [Tanacetum coccineum]
MDKFPNIPKRLEEDYLSIKDDVPLVSVYTMGNVLVREMLIPDAFLTEEIREMNDFKEYEMVFMKVDVPMNQPPLKTKKRKQIAGESSLLRKLLKITIKQKQLVEKDDNDSEDRIEPESHMDNPEVVDDYDDKEREKHDDEMGSLEIRNEETQTTIPTPLSSPRKILSSDKKTFQELTDIVPNLTISTSKHSRVKKRISSKYSYLPGALRRMCRRQGYMIQDMERKCVTTAKFWETHNKIDDILHEVVPQIAENVTNDLIEANLKPCIVNTIIEDRDAFRSEVPAFVSQEFKTHAPKIITKLFEEFVQSNVIHVHPTTSLSTPTDSSVDLQYQLYLKMKRSLQDRADNITLWEALRRKFEKSSTSNTSCREDDFHSHHDEHQANDAPPEGKKIVKKENVVDEDEVIPEDVTPELIAKSQNVNKRVLTIFDHARMEATLRDSLSNMSRIAEEYAYHLEQLTSFMENQIYGNTEEKKYILSLHKIHAEEFLEPDLEEKSCVIWERVHDFQLGIENYQMKVNLTAPTLTFPGIEEHAPYTIVDEPRIGLIYLNSKDEKRVMYLEEIVKFCDATLEKVLNEVKLRMFENKFLKKPPLLGELDQDIMKAYEREISKRLSHLQQMRRWESFVN